MQLFILTNADGSPVADKSESAVVSMTDRTVLQDAGELVLGDSEGIELKFTTATGAAPAFAGQATYIPAITLGSLTTDGSGNYAGATGFASITAGWSARIAMTSTALISAINILGSGYGNPRGGWLTLQVQVTDPAGHVQTYAMIKVFVEWRVLASSSLEPLTPVEEVLANSANVAALRTALSLSGTNTGDQTIALSGDISGTGTAGITTTLATVNANAGSFGSATAAPVLTVNGKGLVTAASSATITPAVGSISGLGTGVVALLAGAASGTGGPAGTTSPVFVAPALGAATGTSLMLSGTDDATDATGLTGSIGSRGGLSVVKNGYFGGNVTVGKGLASESANLILAGGEDSGKGAHMTIKRGAEVSGYVGTASGIVSPGGYDYTLTLAGIMDGILLYTDGNVKSAHITSLGTTFYQPLTANDTTDATTADGLTGAVRSLGGASVKLKLFVGTDLRVNGMCGFNNTTPIAKPTVTGSRGSNAALASLLTALANYGLVTDSSS